MGYKINNRCNTEGIPMYIINQFLKEIQINTLIELGTAGGLSTKEAAKYFKEVITIELNKDRPVCDPSLTNVRWLFGNSIDVLPDLIKELVSEKPEEERKYVIFFIDSHFDGDKPEDSPYKDCYLLEELDIISLYAQDAIIIIDDARLFMGNPPYPNKPNEWPTIQQVFKLFEEKYKYFFVTIIDDYILAIPDRIEWIFQEEWVSRYKERYPDDDERVRMAAKLSYESFLKYISQ